MIDAILEALETLIPSFFPREPFAYPRRYRVVRMRPSASSAEQTRVELQIVNKATGYPDALMVPIWLGTAGAAVEFTPGVHVLVQWIDGDREQPFISHASTRDDPAWRPVNMRIDATTRIAIGTGSSLPAAARVGDTVDLGSWSVTVSGGFVSAVKWIPPGGGLPQALPIDPALPLALTGSVSSGSGKVTIE